MQFNQFVEWVFYGILSGCFIYGVSILKDLNKSIETLNNQIAVVIEKVTWHEKWLERHDGEIQVLRNNN